MEQKYTWETRNWYWKAFSALNKISLHNKAKVKGLSLSEINKAAGWKETSTFRRFYNELIFKTFVTYLLCKPNLFDIFNIYYVYSWNIFSVFSNHFNVCWFCYFKNPVYFEMDWVRYCKGEFPNHTSTVCDGWLKFSWAIYLTQTMKRNMPHPKCNVVPSASHSNTPDRIELMLLFIVWVR